MVRYLDLVEEIKMEDKKEYHILSLSGGKDSTALAFFMNISEFSSTQLHLYKK